MSVETTAGVRLDVDGPVARITLCRPESRNAQSPAMWAALAAIGRDLPADVRVVRVQAEGPSFSAGLDRQMFTVKGIPGQSSLPALSRLPSDELDDVLAGYQQGFSWLRRDDLVSVAVVQGHAVGAGFQLALACDLRVLAHDAQLAMRETSLGLVPDLGGTHPLVQAVGYSRALEICLTGRWVDADEARQLGLATIVVPREELTGTADDLIAAVLSADRGAVSATKSLLSLAAMRSYDEQLEAERTSQRARLRAVAEHLPGKISE